MNQDILNNVASVVLIVAMGLNFSEFLRLRRQRLTLHASVDRIEAQLARVVRPLMRDLERATDLLRAIDRPPEGTNAFLVDALAKLDAFKQVDK